MLLNILGVSILTSLSIGASAGSMGQGGPCSVTNNHLDQSSHKLISECTDQTFCSTAENGTCLPRRCRRDEFPFGFDIEHSLPPLCADGSFCPDEGSGCQPLASVGTPCQLNRDEQCAPPPDWKDLTNSQNFNGSICLRSICAYANMTLGQPCITENTTYLDFGPCGEQYTITILRDNCHSPRFYCDSPGSTCQRTKPLLSPCSIDAECSTHNCGPNAICTEPPETPLRVAPWQWALTAASVLSAMIATCVMLTLVHKRHRYKHQKELQEYYIEQLSLRRAIISLHLAAADQYYQDKREHRAGFDTERP